MTVGTAHFNATSVASFSRLDKEISALQQQVSSGKNDPTPSSDLMRASRLSALSEVESRLTRFDGNINQISDRLSIADTVLGEVTSVTTRLQELAIQAASDTTSSTGRQAIKSEAIQLRDSLLGLANAKDSIGHNLFGGFNVKDQAFVASEAGGIAYDGDRGVHVLRVSETVDLRTGIDGAAAFMQVRTDSDTQSLFGIVDRFVSSLEPKVAESARSFKSEGGATRLDIHATREPSVWAFELKGPTGSVDVSAELVDDVPGPLIDAINAHSATTGVIARLDADNRGVVLERADGLAIEFEGLTISGSNGLPADDGDHFFELSSPDTDTQPVRMLDFRQHSSTILGDLNDAVDHVIRQRADIGALAGAADMQKSQVENRQLNLEKAISGLEDADIAKSITLLQSLLVNRQAAQATFAKITQQSLFDYLR